MKNRDSKPSLRPFAKRVAAWIGLFVGGMSLLSAPNRAAADDCGVLGGSINGGVCETSAQVTVSGTLTLNETLRILGGGNITVPAAAPQAPGTPLTLNITGDFIMEAGSSIVGDVKGARKKGAHIAITTTGNMLLRGSGALGATISAHQKGTCTGGGAGGTIALTALTGMITTEQGSLITTDANCPAGEIIILADIIDINGKVSAYGKLSGSGLSRAGGGPITVKASCALAVGDTGVISSKGKDTGADLVHLEAGCDLIIYGLVESTGPGHAIPNSPPNRCNSAFRPDKPPHSTACVEVWSGYFLLIDNRGSHNGEVSADTAQFGGTNGFGWIDLFSKDEIEVLAASTGTFAVHANALLPNATGGLITVKSMEETVAAVGQAFQADGMKSGGNGGDILVEAKTNQMLMPAHLSAQGDSVPAGGLGTGGIVAARSFDGEVRWAMGDGNVSPAATGMINLTACSGVVTTGTDFHGVTPITNPNLCTGASPTLPFYVTLPMCICKK